MFAQPIYYIIAPNKKYPLPDNEDGEISIGNGAFAVIVEADGGVPEMEVSDRIADIINSVEI